MTDMHHALFLSPKTIVWTLRSTHCQDPSLLRTWTSYRERTFVEYLLQPHGETSGTCKTAGATRMGLARKGARGAALGCPVSLPSASPPVQLSVTSEQWPQDALGHSGSSVLSSSPRLLGGHLR